MTPKMWAARLHPIFANAQLGYFLRFPPVLACKKKDNVDGPTRDCHLRHKGERRGKASRANSQIRAIFVSIDCNGGIAAT